MKQMLKALFLTAALSTTTAAQDKLILALNPEFAPWQTTINGQAAGIDIDIIKYIAQKMNLTVEYKMAPWARCQMYLKDGSADILGFLGKNSDREVYMTYLNPPYQGDVKVFFMRKGEKDKLKSYEDLYKLKIGVGLGFVHYEPFDSDKKINKTEFTTVDQACKMLIGGRFDAFIDNNTEQYGGVKKSGYLDKIELSDYTVTIPNSGYFALSKKSKLLPRRAEFEAILKEMTSSGKLKSIIDNGIKTYN